MARAGASSSATEVRAHLVRAESRRRLGLLAPACIPVERNAAKHLVIHSVFCWLGCSQRDRDPVVQRIVR